jgi:hypothetical protein
VEELFEVGIVNVVPFPILDQRGAELVAEPGGRKSWLAIDGAVGGNLQQMLR